MNSSKVKVKQKGNLIYKTNNQEPESFDSDEDDKDYIKDCGPEFEDNSYKGYFTKGECMLYVIGEKNKRKKLKNIKNRIKLFV